MSNQKWADACTQNCIWLFQSRRLPNGCYRPTEETKFDDEPEYELDEDTFGDEDGWHTEGVFLNRLEAFEAGARRVYNYGQYGKDWRIYGVPAHGELVTLLAQAGVNQEYIDKNVENYKIERKEWEATDKRLRDE